MRNHEYGEIEILLQFADYLEHVPPQTWAETAEGFIKQQDRFLPQKYPCKCDALAFPAG